MAILDKQGNVLVSDYKEKAPSGFSNVVNTLKAAITGKGVSSKLSSSNNKIVSKTGDLLSKAASNPFKTAGVVAIAMNPTAAVGTAKAIGNKAVSSFASSSITTQAGVVGGAIVGTNILIASPKARKAVLNTPDSLANFGQNIGYVSENPSLENAKLLFEENPFLTTAVVGGTAAAVGGGLTGAVATYFNTKAVKENTKAALGGGSTSPISQITPTSSDILPQKTNGKVADVSTFSKLGSTAEPLKRSKSYTRKRKKRSAEPKNINIRVYNNDYYGRSK